MNPSQLTYLDNNASTPLATEVQQAMQAALLECFGNPSSIHRAGQKSSFAIAKARQSLAKSLNAHPSEIVFTSGGTESDNLAIKGVLANQPDKKHLMISTVEHEAVLKTATLLSEQGYELTLLGVDSNGQLNLNELDSVIRPDTVLVSIMAANNETGALFPINQIAAICKNKNVLFHTDAVQAVGKILIDVKALGVDLLSLSGHKFHGPKGVGALFIRRGLTLSPEITGGLQERGLRAGTENVVSIVGLGAAAELLPGQLEKMSSTVQALRDELERKLQSLIPGIVFVGQRSPRLPNTCQAIFPDHASEEILLGLSEAGICASGGSACHSGALNPSEVLLQMGYQAHQAIGAVRFSLSVYNQADDIEHLLQTLATLLKKMKKKPAHSTVMTGH